MWKKLGSLTALMTKTRAAESDKAAEIPRTLLGPPARDDVLNGFRLILGRELTDESTISAQLGHRTIAELRLSLLNSEEFRGKFKILNPVCSDHPDLSRGRGTLAFIHLQKTGGMSLRALLQAQYQPDRVCPVIDNNLHLLSLAELGRYDLFVGHFDRTSVSLIPRDNIRTVTLLREPRARLISFYRFHRSHPITDEFANNFFVRLAHEFAAEQFFERDEVRAAAEVYNHYLIALGRSFAWYAHNRTALSKSVLEQALADAKQHVSALTALGITERFEQSIEYISKSLNLSSPRSIESVNVTDNSPALDRRFRRVDPVEMTPRLSAALEDLVAFDEEIYRYAVNDFEHRRSELAARSASTSS